MEIIVGQGLWLLIFYFCISVIFLILSWVLYYNFTKTHIPPGNRHGGKLRFLSLIIRIALRLGTVLEKLGLCHEFLLWKLLVSCLLPVRARDLVITEALFDAVPVRIYQCKTANPGKKRGLVWLHGGGGLCGSYRSHERLCCYFARETSTVVVFVEYPLAPQHPYPAQQHSCYAAVSYFLRNAADFGVDPHRVVLGGESSGAALVAAVSQELVFREDLPRVRAHALLNPFLQGVDFNLPSYQQNQWMPLLCRRDMIRMGAFYLTGKKLDIDSIISGAHFPEHLQVKYQKWISHEHIPEEFKRRGYVPSVPGPFSEDLFKESERTFEPRFSPLLTEDAVLRRFPETFLLTSEYDVFRDEGWLYKKRLDDNGVRVTWKHLEDGFHASTLLIGLGPLEIPETRKGLKNVILFLERF